MGAEVLVYVQLREGPRLAGRLWARSRRGRESASFEYDHGWLAHPERFALDPALQLGTDPFHTETGRPLFGPLGDSAPDLAQAVSTWRSEARRLGLGKTETERMASAFDHEDREAAL